MSASPTRWHPVAEMYLLTAYVPDVKLREGATVADSEDGNGTIQQEITRAYALHQETALTPRCRISAHDGNWQHRSQCRSRYRRAHQLQLVFRSLSIHPSGSQRLWLQYLFAPRHK